MLNINTSCDSGCFTFSLVGRLDTATAPELEAELKSAAEGAEKIVFNFSELEYISSAGLRVILTAQKLMLGHGKMELHNVNDSIMEVFRITGFDDILTIC